MKRGSLKVCHDRRMLALLVCLVMGAILIPPAAQAREEGKVVRVGWYESAFHRTDQFGRRSGYGYEYQQRLSIYTGWRYEYVEGSWSELLEKLIAGAVGGHLEHIELFDVYEGVQVGLNKKSVAFSLRLRAADRTLTDEEADAAVKNALAALAEVGATLRA